MIPVIIYFAKILFASSDKQVNLLPGLYKHTPRLLKHNPNFTANNDPKYQTKFDEINPEKNRAAWPGFEYSAPAFHFELEGFLATQDRKDHSRLSKP